MKLDKLNDLKLHGVKYEKSTLEIYKNIQCNENHNLTPYSTTQNTNNNIKNENNITNENTINTLIQKVISIQNNENDEPTENQKIINMWKQSYKNRNNLPSLDSNLINGYLQYLQNNFPQVDKVSQTHIPLENSKNKNQATNILKEIKSEISQKRIKLLK